MKEGQHVKHVNPSIKLHEARFSGYTKTGRVRVTHNIIYPYGVCWATYTFKAENIIKA